MKSLTAALDLLSTLAPHRVKGTPSGKGDKARVAYTFNAGSSNNWDASLDDVLNAIRTEHAFMLSVTPAGRTTFLATAVSRANVGARPALTTTTRARDHLTAAATATAAYLTEELSQCAP